MFSNVLMKFSVWWRPISVIRRGWDREERRVRRRFKQSDVDDIVRRSLLRQWLRNWRWIAIGVQRKAFRINRFPSHRLLLENHYEPTRNLRRRFAVSRLDRRVFSLTQNALQSDDNSPFVNNSFFALLSAFTFLELILKVKPKSAESDERVVSVNCKPVFLNKNTNTKFKYPHSSRLQPLTVRVWKLVLLSVLPAEEQLSQVGKFRYESFKYRLSLSSYMKTACDVSKRNSLRRTTNR